MFSAGPTMVPGRVGPFGFPPAVISHSTAVVAPPAIATLIMALPTTRQELWTFATHPHLQHHDEVAVVTDSVVALALALIVIYLLLREYRSADR